MRRKDARQNRVWFETLALLDRRKRLIRCFQHRVDVFAAMRGGEEVVVERDGCRRRASGASVVHARADA